jgi:glycosyltransferase involved in cell wall biosynthesis
MADRTVVTNAGLADIVGRNGGRAFVLPDRIPALSPSGNAGPSGGRHVVFVCTFAPDEPFAEVVEAARVLGPAVTVHVTGNARRAPRQVVEGAPENVRFTGFLPEEAYVDLLARADVVVDLTTREDCLVCGGYEAVALGRPLVTSDTRALRAHFSAGTVHSAPDRHALAAAIREALDDGARLGREMSALKPRLEADWESWLAHLAAWVHGRGGRGGRGARGDRGPNP